MKSISAFGCLLLISVSTAPAAKADKYPVTPASVNYGGDWFDPIYLRQIGCNHLGRDFKAYSGQVVVSPIDGYIVRNRTYETPDRAYLIIRDRRNNGHEHVLGHISSSLPVSTSRLIRAGQKIGTVKRWMIGTRNNTHVHWGVNKTGILRSGVLTGGTCAEGAWGWGKAPPTADKVAARARGWVKRSSDP